LRLALTREITCIRSLAWRCDLPAGCDLDALAAALEASELTRQPTVRGLQRFASAAGDEILVVMASRRVQFRVHYTIPEHERRFAAERLFQRVVYALLRP
jgi:hypothetical protein